MPGTIDPILDVSRPRRIIILSGLTSIILAGVKIAVGVVGHSYALIADGIESLTDLVSSIAVFLGLTFSVMPPDSEHPYGHGKLETFSTMIVSVVLFIAAGLIAFQSTHAILEPHPVPSWFTLPVLAVVIVTKIIVSKALSRSATSYGSTALKADAWHHLSDALTSGFAFIGISIALIGGENWAKADAWAALAACVIILVNGIRIANGGVHELLEGQAPADLEQQLRALAKTVPGVLDVEKLRVRKSGLTYLMDIHIEVDGTIPVFDGHEIARAVKRTIIASPLRVADVTVHVEPHASHGTISE